MKLLLAFIAFNFIVIIHELGHFVVAKLYNIKVQEFSLFFGPKLFSVQRGETMYSIRLIPALAYVKLEGEEEASTSERAFNKKSVPVRAAVFAAGPFLNILLGVILFYIVFSVTGFNTNVIDIVQKDSPAYASGIQAGDKIISYDNKRVYQPMEVGLFLYGSKGKPTQIELQRGSQKIVTSVTPQVIPAQSRYLLGFVPKEASGADSNIVDQVDPSSPAGKAGLLANDRIIGLDGKTVSDRQAINDFVGGNKDKPIQVTVKRSNSTVTLNITPMLQKNPEQYYLGVDFKSGRGGFAELAKESVVNAYSIVRVSLYSIAWLIAGKVPADQMTGPVGIVSTINDVVQQSPSLSLVFLNLLSMTGLISIGLGVSNLFPIPPADGSKLLLLGVEAVRRRPLPIEKEAVIMMVGFVIMMILFVFLTYNDIARLVLRTIPGG